MSKTTGLYPITYRCPGGLSLTYSTTIPAYLPRLKHTLIGGIALWRMWVREVLFLLLTGRVPYPSIVTQNVAGDISRVVRRLRWEAAINVH